MTNSAVMTAAYTVKSSVTVAYGELESALSSLPVNTAETPYVITIASTNLSARWAVIIEAIRGAGRYVILDLSDCTADDSTITGKDYKPVTFAGLESSAYVKGLVLPSTLKTIGDYAFRGCRGLTTVTIPAGVTSIGCRAFDGCAGLVTVIFESGDVDCDDAFPGYLPTAY